MRKLLFLALLCIVLLPARVFAVEDRALEPTAMHASNAPGNLKAAWGANYEKAPDMGGLYWDNDSQRICVLLVNGGTEARKQEVIALVGNADWISFKSCKYSYAQLKAAWEEIGADMINGNGVVGVGMDEKRNYVTVGILAGTPETVAQGYIQRYGDMVRIEEGAISIPKTDGAKRGPGIPKTGAAATFGWLWPLALGSLCLGIRAKGRK